MAKLCQPLPVLLCLCCAASFILFSHAERLSFEFPPFRDINKENDAQYQDDSQEEKLQLTKSDVSTSLIDSRGCASYNKRISLWDSSSRALANFSTYFQFVIGTSTENGNGDGLAFFLAPFGFKQPSNAIGGGLGLFTNETYDGSPYQMVAVEFDTFQNDYDPHGDHVGIDINSVISKVNVSIRDSSGLSRTFDQNLRNGERWDAWVDYHGGEKCLRVFLSNSSSNSSVSKPESPLISYDIDLREFLPKNIKVGLSASTGSLTETHTVNAWNFSCEYSWEAAPPIKFVKLILISVSCIVVAVCGFIFVDWRWLLSKSKNGGEAREEINVELDEWFSHGPRRFSYSKLSAATRNFCDDEKLGQGGFGGVYRGILSCTGEAVAVKRIAQGSKQGRKEYVSEVTIISRLRHRNLVQLLGWCHEKGELLLVYEYLPNGSLDKHIFGKEKDTLHWDLRYSIACDIASALVYLHEDWEQRVVHRDVKASNVMLDSSFTAKLGDFGLARLMERDQAASHTTVVAGTWGYLAPECCITGKTSPEADVYSFGAVSLEIACGRRAVDRTLDEHNSRLVEWVWDFYGKGKVLDAADEELGGNFNAEDMERLMVVGLLCSNLNSTSRPKMREVIKILKREAELPYVPLDLPVAVYSQRLHRDMTSGLSTSTALTCPSVVEPTLSPSSSAVEASNLSSSTAKNSSVKMSSPLLLMTDLASLDYLMQVGI